MEHILSHKPDEGANVLVDAERLHALITHLLNVEQQETRLSAKYTYNVKSEEHKTGDLVTEIDLETAEYPSAHSFFNQRLEPAVSALGFVTKEFTMYLGDEYKRQIIDAGKSQQYDRKGNPIPKSV